MNPPHKRLVSNLVSVALLSLGGTYGPAAWAAGDLPDAGEYANGDGYDAGGGIVIDSDPGDGGDILLEGDVGAEGDGLVIEGDEPGSGGELLILDGDGPGPGGDLLILDEAAPVPEPQPMDGGISDLRLAVDDVRLEYGQQLRDASAADHALYGKLAVSLNWRPQAEWELQLAGRVDGYREDGRRDWSGLRADYGDSYLRYRGDNIRLTAGSQTVIWGRMDEVPLSDRVSTADLTRFVLDRLEDRRRSAPMLRVETNVGAGRLDMLWLYDFRAAELPDRDSIWYPIDQVKGRILGVDRADIAPGNVIAANIVEDEPGGDGGFGIRYTASPYFGDIGITLAHTRQSTPYYRVASGGTVFRTEYPRSWILGADTAVDALGATWRAELVYSSDNPVTRRNFAYTTTEGVDWGLGVELYPGDGDTRVNLQLVGSNLIDPPAVLDRTEAYSLNGEIEIPFDRARWKASLDFFLGLDQEDLYLSPEIAFLAWEPHEVYLALHYFDGDEQTLGGFHEDHSTLNLGWRATF